MISTQRLLILTLLVCCVTSCAPAPNNSNTTITQATPSPSASPSPAQTETTSSVHVTLPLLDALLTDEKFVGQLKSKVKLTDDQIAQLKRVSSAAVDRLRESNAEDLDASGNDARSRADEELRNMLGEQKARDVAAAANDYWSKGDTDEATAGNNPKAEMLKGPNAVPTDTRVVVNIPAFRMDLFHDGSLVKSYKIGIGYPQFPLPQGLRKAQTLIFNPTWTPPDSPWVAKMKNVTPGEKVEAGDKDNPLGPIKIPIGLPSLIHGNKPASKIGKFASHGCVGLTNAQMKDFTIQLARASNTTEISDKTVNEYLQNKEKTQTVKLNQAVPVELRYETIVLEDGKLHIYKDVYAQDTNTEENLRQVLEAHGIKLEDLSEQQRQQALDGLNSKSNKEIVIDLTGKGEKGYPAPQMSTDKGRIKS